MNIDSLSLNFHCGCSREVVDRQIEDQKGLEKIIPNIDYNLRIDRYPKTYPSYSHLMNHAIATSKCEYMIFINDRCKVSVDETLKILNLLQSGFSCVLLYNVAYMGFTKELVRKIGWWDQRFLLGGWEDRDWVFRIAQADLALYESQESSYDYSWKSPLQEIGHQCRLSQPHWDKKYDQKYADAIVKMIPEEKYECWDFFIGEEKPEISSSWKKWSDSILNGPGFDKPNSGQSSSSMIKGRKIVNYEDIKHLIK